MIVPSSESQSLQPEVVTARVLKPLDISWTKRSSRLGDHDATERLPVIVPPSRVTRMGHSMHQGPCGSGRRRAAGMADT